MTAQEIIEKIRAKVESLYDEANNYDDSSHYLGEVLSYLSDLEKEEKPKRVRTLEKEFDGYNPIVVTLDKYVLKSIGVVRHDEVIIKIQRKED